jgi:RimJ/RimL family protein N-acetyltransferase
MAVDLETERLRLRRWREEDVDPFHAFYRDPESERIYGADVARHDVWRRIATIIGHFELRGFGLWALEEKSSRSFAGYAGLWFPDGWDDVEVGYGIAPQHRGKGYATEAARRSRDYGYADLGIARLVSYVNPINAASIRVAEKLGAFPDGEFIMHGKPHMIFRHPTPNIETSIKE